MTGFDLEIFEKKINPPYWTATVDLYHNIFLYSRPTCCTVEDLATDLRTREAEVPVSEPLPNDLPPKYDDLEQPPRYEDHVQNNNNLAQQQQR